MPISPEEHAFICQITRREDITDTSNVCLPLADLVEMTVAQLEIQSMHTARTYRSFIYRFLRYLDAAVGDQIPQGVASVWCPFIEEAGSHRPRKWVIRPPAAVLHLIQPEIWNDYAARLAFEGLKDTSIESRLHGARALLRVARKAGVLTDIQAFRLGVRRFPTQEYTALRVARASDPRPGRVLSRVEVRWLRNHVDLRTNKGKRDLAILDGLLYFALHPEELRLLSKQSLVQENGQWWLMIPGRTQKELHRLRVKEEPLMSLITWIEALTLSAHTTSLPVFVAISRGDNIGKRAIGAAAIENIVVTYGFQSRLTPLDGSGRLTSTILRRTCARTAYDNGASLAQIKTLLGYATVGAAARFIGLEETTSEASAVDFISY